jgi:hypothetical protein
MDIQALEAAARPTRAFGAKGIFATVLGNGFEFFDFGVYAIYIGIIGQTFYPADNPFVSDRDRSNELSLEIADFRDGSIAPV